METQGNLLLPRVRHRIISSILLPPPFRQLTEEHYRPDIGCETPHRHSSFQILGVIKGDFSIITAGGKGSSGKTSEELSAPSSPGEGNSEYRLLPGDCILLPVNFPHAWRNGKQETQTIQILMETDPALPEEEYGELAMLPKVSENAPVKLSLPPRIWERCHRKISPPFLRLRPGGSLILMSALLELLGELLQAAALHHDVRNGEFRMKHPLHPGMEKVFRCLLEHPERKHSLSSLAKTACLSTSRFSEVFRESCGVPPMEYLVRRRMELAKQMLQTSNRSLEEIVSSFRMKSVSYFIRKFKSFYGTTPASFRRNAEEQWKQSGSLLRAGENGKKERDGRKGKKQKKENEIT